MVEIRRLDAEQARRQVAALAAVLVDCVDGGASVSFMAPLTQPAAERFYKDVAKNVEGESRLLLDAFDESSLVGSVQVVTAMPPNQPHRAEVVKLLVHRSARGHGVGRLLMEAAERHARAAGKTLLVLDTATGGEAERLYERLGWVRVGTIPGYALLPDGTPGATTVFWKALGTQP